MFIFICSIYVHVKIKFCLLRFLLKLYGNRLILTYNCLVCSPALIPFKTYLSNPYLRPFFIHGTGAGTGTRSETRTYGKITVLVPVLTVEKWWFLRCRFQFRLQLRNTANDNSANGAGYKFRRSLKIPLTIYEQLFFSFLTFDAQMNRSMLIVQF